MGMFFCLWIINRILVLIIRKLIKLKQVMADEWWMIIDITDYWLMIIRKLIKLKQVMADEWWLIID